MEFVIYLQLSITMEFVIYFQSIINSDWICDWFAIIYQFHMEFLIYSLEFVWMVGLIIASEWITNFR